MKRTDISKPRKPEHTLEEFLKLYNAHKDLKEVKRRMKVGTRKLRTFAKKAKVSYSRDFLRFNFKEMLDSLRDNNGYKELKLKTGHTSGGSVRKAVFRTLYYNWKDNPLFPKPRRKLELICWAWCDLFPHLAEDHVLLSKVTGIKKDKTYRFVIWVNNHRRQHAANKRNQSRSGPTNGQRPANRSSSPDVYSTNNNGQPRENSRLD